MNTYPICDSPLRIKARHSFDLLEKSCQNHRSYERTEALPSIVFVPAQILPGIKGT